MNQFAKTVKMLTKRAALFLAFAFMLTAIVATAISAGSGDPTMTVIFNADECEVFLSYPGIEQDPYPMVSGEPVEIPYGKAVTVTVKPLLGYQLNDIVDADNPTDSIKSLYAPTYYNQNFLNSVRAEVQCSTRIFNVKFEKADVTQLPYTFPSIDSDVDLTTMKYHYMQSGNLTYLPTVARTGYTFNHWSVIKSDGTEVQKITTKTEEGVYYISPDIINQDMVDQGTIYLHAEFVPELQPVTRYDYVYNVELGVTDKLLGTYEWQAEMDASVSALTQMGDDKASDDPSNPYLNYKSYPGYKLMLNGSYPKEDITIPTPQKPNPNTFDRFYVPVVYTLVYENLLDGTLPEGAPQTYTYSAYTPIQQPTRRGYTFLGWKVSVDGAVVDAQTGADFVLGNQDAGNAKYAAKDEKIVLTAIWQANTYDITYDWNVTDDALKAELDTLNAALPKSFVFDAADLTINDAIRHGYAFLGWTLHYTDGESNPATLELTSTEGKYMLNCNTYAQSIQLTAKWQVESYTVVLDGQGAADGFTTQIPGVVYDVALNVPTDFVVPTKKGFTFRGYWSAKEGGSMYIDEAGQSVCSKWNLYEDTDGAITLYARWERNNYNVTIQNIVGLPASAQVTIRIIAGTTYTYTGEPIPLPYETEFRVEIVMPAGFKIVQWNGVDLVPHSGDAFLSDVIVVDAEDMTLTSQARPTAPMLNGDVDSIRPKSDTEIKVLFASAEIAARYEVAISLDGDVANLADDAWYAIADGSDFYLFAELQPGTTYYVFVRLKATTETLSGIPFMQPTLTKYDVYVESMVDTLNGMLGDDDGDIAKAVIQETIAKIDELRNTDPLPPDFYQMVQDLVAAVEAKLVFARLQDTKITDLQAFLGECLNSGSFNNDNKALLNSLCATAVANISAATTEQDVESIYQTAKEAMQVVPVTYLYDANGLLQLISELGLNQNSGVTLRSIEDIRVLRRAVADAIAQGKITADSFITIEEAENLLRALDTVSAYSFHLINVQATADNSFIIRMAIPEALAGRTGLQVAYYNEATGTVELLETTVEGNTLVFKAKHIADFVILADPTVDLSAVIIALAAVLFCQLIALALVLVSRSKGKVAAQNLCVALPMFLTVHFLPHNAEFIALILGVAVVLMQIVLMWLLLSSNLIHVPRLKKAAREEKREVPAVLMEDVLPTEPMADEETTPEAAEEEATEEIAEDLYEEPAAEETEDTVADEFAPAEEVEEIYDDEEFVGTDDEFVPIDEEDYDYTPDEEDVIDYEENRESGLETELEDAEGYGSVYEESYAQAEAEDAQTETASTDADPFEGIFGDADWQDGNSGDEGRDSRYAEALDESFGYDDEENAAYTETEDADGAETEGQGSVDPYAYVVEDEEEVLSDEEELYRYDE